MCRASSAPGSIDAVRFGVEHVRNLLQRHAAVANRTPHQAVTFGRELCDVVLQVHMTDPTGGAPGEGDRIFTDGEWVSRVEHEADVLARFACDVDQFLAREVLMVLDRERKSDVRGTIRFHLERGASMRDHLFPARAQSASGAFEDGCQVQAQERCAERARTADGVFQRLSGPLDQPVAADNRHPRLPQGFADARQIRFGQRRQPTSIEFDAPCANRPGELDESRQTERRGRRAPGRRLKEPDREADAVWVQSDSEARHHSIRGTRSPNPWATGFDCAEYRAGTTIL